ncbi:MAG: GldG family protein [Granulosicoccus sp.]|nr:GldG family protein [Granulosicoccus sp.]
MMKSIRIHTLLSLLSLLVVLCLLWFAERFSTSLDVTANKRHSLSPTTISLLNAMNKPVDVIAVLGLNQQQLDAVNALISRFRAVKPDISLKVVNHELQPAEARALNAAPGGELILRSDEREQRIQTLSERSLANALQRLMREGERQLAFIVGHNERSPSRMTNHDWQAISQRLASIGLISREVSLVSEPYLGDDIDLLVIADPRRPYFPGEIVSINNYIARGGNLLWLGEIASDSRTGPGLTPVSDNLGIDFLPGTVIDTASQGLAAGSADFVLLDRFPVHPVTQHLTGPVLLPQASAIAVTPLAGQTELPLLRTPDSSWTETGELSGEIRFDENTDEIAGPLMLGVTIERQLPGGNQRFAVIGDADFAASQFVENGANQAFIESLILWLTGDADALQFVTRSAPDGQLMLSDRARIFLFLACLCVLPILFISIAFAVRWVRRRD